MIDNTAYVLVGAPGVGKSFLARTFIKSHPSAVWIEGDSFASDSWVTMHDQILEELGQHAGDTVVLEGTHHSRESRLGALVTLRSLGWRTVRAVVVHPPLAVCITQNALRSKIIPRHDIVECHRRIEKSLKKLEQEGFSSVIYAPEGEWV